MDLGYFVLVRTVVKQSRVSHRCTGKKNSTNPPHHKNPCLAHAQIEIHAQTQKKTVHVEPICCRFQTEKVYRGWDNEQPQNTIYAPNSNMSEHMQRGKTRTERHSEGCIINRLLGRGSRWALCDPGCCLAKKNRTFPRKDVI